MDLPKSAFTEMTWDNVFQMKFDGQFNADGSANGDGWDVYIDNIFFYREVSTSLVPTEVAASPTIPEANVVSILVNHMVFDLNECELFGTVRDS